MPPKPGKRYETEGLATPSGKIELSSSILEKAGYDPLPAYHEQQESPAAQPELAREYPLVLTTGARLLAFTHANHLNLPSLSHREPHPRVEVHPNTAGGLGIEDGDDVLVETLRGSIQVKAWVTRDIVPGVAQVSHGWSGASANTLTPNDLRDPILGYPNFRALLCRIRKV